MVDFELLKPFEPRTTGRIQRFIFKVTDHGELIHNRIVYLITCKSIPDQEELVVHAPKNKAFLINDAGLLVVRIKMPSQCKRIALQLQFHFAPPEAHSPVPPSQHTTPSFLLFTRRKAPPIPNPIEALEESFHTFVRTFQHHLDQFKQSCRK